MPRPRQKLIGRQIGYWTVLREDADIYATNGSVRRVLVVKCKCGTVKSVLEQNLVNKRSLSCGCYKREMAHRNLQDFWKRKVGITHG